MKYWKIIFSIICLVCIVIFCIVAIIGKIYTLYELPLNFMSAFLGAIVTAVITLILLSGQSSAEEIKERNVIVFNKKSVIFEEFINRLYNILQKQKINGNTYREINTEFYTKLVLYLKKESRQKITSSLEKLAECIGIEMDNKNITDAELNNNYYELRECIFSIINILIDDLGLGGKIDINMQEKLEKNTFPYLLYQTLLEEADNLFFKKGDGFFGKAHYTECKDGVFIIITIEGKISLGGRIEIGPFVDGNQGELAQKNLIFRLLSPPFNTLAEEYASRRKANVEGKYIKFYCEELEDEYDEYDQINLSYFDKTNLEKLEVDKEDIYNNFIFQFGFDDCAYTRFCGFYLSVCKAIAARAYYYFLTTKTSKDKIPLKELCEKFGAE